MGIQIQVIMAIVRVLAIALAAVVLAQALPLNDLDATNLIDVDQPTVAALQSEKTDAAAALAEQKEEAKEATKNVEKAVQKDAEAEKKAEETEKKAEETEKE